MFDDYAAARAVIADMETPPGRFDDDFREAHFAHYAVEAWCRSMDKEKAHQALKKVSAQMKEKGKVGFLGIQLAQTDAAGAESRRQDLRDRWILLEDDGSYTTVGRQSYPTREEITGFCEGLREAGKGGWLVRTKGSHHEPRKVPEVTKVEAVGRFPRVPFEEAVAEFGRRILERNAS